MSPGPDPDPSWEDYIECVEELYDEGTTNGTGGVRAYAIAAELDVPVSTARHHLNGLVMNDELDDCWGTPNKGRPPRGYIPKGADCGGINDD